MFGALLLCFYNFIQVLGPDQQVPLWPFFFQDKIMKWPVSTFKKENGTTKTTLQKDVLDNPVIIGNNS